MYIIISIHFFTLLMLNPHRPICYDHQKCQKRLINLLEGRPTTSLVLFGTNISPHTVPVRTETLVFRTPQ